MCFATNFENVFSDLMKLRNSVAIQTYEIMQKNLRAYFYTPTVCKNTHVFAAQTLSDSMLKAFACGQL